MQDGMTALHLAAQFGNTKEIALLLDRNADVTAVQEVSFDPDDVCGCVVSFSMIYFQIAHNLVCGCVGLLSNDIMQDGMTALHLVVEFGSTEAVMLLLDRGADVNAVDDVRVTVEIRGKLIFLR